jgi:hypothetical protein
MESERVLDGGPKISERLDVKKKRRTGKVILDVEVKAHLRLTAQVATIPTETTSPST